MNVVVRANISVAIAAAAGCCCFFYSCRASFSFNCFTLFLYGSYSAINEIYYALDREKSRKEANKKYNNSLKCSSVALFVRRCIVHIRLLFSFAVNLYIHFFRVSVCIFVIFAVVLFLFSIAIGLVFCFHDYV